ncbi:hypothetical protein H0H92_011813 [Tricholoma furcatifolium]|nr:hypothetical protein H0H92_011813 [Tricholoma furcatifolium]
MSQTAWAFLDNSISADRLTFNVQGGSSSEITVQEDDGYLNGTATQYRQSTTLLFSGIAVGFYGSAESLWSNIPIQVYIDGQQVANATPEYFQAVTLFYQSPTLSDGQHNVTVIQDDYYINLDYMLVTPGNETFLAGDPIVVDDTDPSIVYQGSWTSNNTLLTADGLVYRYPFENAFHQTQDSQASVTFNFTGTAVGVYGVYDANTPFPQVTFTLDGQQTVASNTNTSQTDINYLWYSGSSLSPTNHTLSIDFAGVDPIGRFSLDYIIYSPSFVQQQVNSTTTGVPDGSSGSASASHPAKPHTVLIGALVGSIAGVLLLSLLAFRFRKQIFPCFSKSPTGRKSRPVTLLEAEEFPPPGPIPDTASVIQPFAELPTHVRSSVVSNESAGPHALASSTGSRETVERKLIAQGGSDSGMREVPGSKAFLAKVYGQGSHSRNGSAGSTSNDIRIPLGGGVDSVRAERIQGLVNELQQEIAASGIVVTHTGRDGAFPPPYEPSVRDESLV